MESYFTSRAVVFLDANDFASAAKFNHKLKTPMVVMIGASFCPHCTDTAPDFNTFALQNKGKCVAAVVQADGSPAEQMLARKLSDFGKFRGIPSFMLYNKNGEFVKVHNDRSVESFQQLYMSI